MPIKNVNRTEPALNHYKHISYETLAASWLTEDGWEVFMPLVDHDKKTDLLIADDTSFYRIQVKALNSMDEDIDVENKWQDKIIDYVIYFSMQGSWGYIVKPFTTNKAKLQSKGHIRFHQHPSNFLKAFKRI
ncbi:group I intron-associated PD-(D/E)XK endonuclease [Thalassotalea nanhaiensis]|uniref:Group I intron-associated PD-(D/E)XK endonuclease n=1 Tax=Thalassotalea nanhaiensis TaxID=3065648 RepID=A0ABY9TGL9_9GAMM|nr:group I intron-associated PD-(D/E)XK endonuclease [Colwelliaceae bacterium SQ345]